MNKQQQIEKMKNKQTENNVFDILDKIEFFQGQRAGRELWNDKPKEMQDKDISDFVRDINYIRSYLQDSVVLSMEEWECLHNDYAKALYNARQNERKETAEKILFKFESVFAYYDNKDMFSKKAIFECIEEIVNLSVLK